MISHRPTYILNRKTNSMKIYYANENKCYTLYNRHVFNSESKAAGFSLIKNDVLLRFHAHRGVGR